ncbi:MAG: TatD family hydrolase [Bacteroidaceae bacterium]|nr:TatD family hydrolase [Bacteroidaceae bacterium]
MIDTHIHIDGEEFAEDLADVVSRAREAGCEQMLVPGINLNSVESMDKVCAAFPDFIKPMIGLHPEDVDAGWQVVLAKMHDCLAANPDKYVAIGEVGLDFYWSREFEQEQLLAFEEQVRWSVERGLPLTIHCRKAQNEMVRILRKYQNRLPGGVFHCFTGNAHEAEELLAFDGFVLGIGGVLTFKKSNLPQTLKEVVPIERIVLETDAPYMAPVPMRGKRNESSYIPYIIEKLSEVYGIPANEIDAITTATAKSVFGI